MSATPPPTRIPSDARPNRAIRLRLFAAIAAISAGVAALVIAILLLRTVLA
jgi:hypothetical protein